MYCPKCNGRKIHRISMSRYPIDVNQIKRKYECMSCGFRFITKESVVNDKGWDRLSYKNELKIQREKEQKKSEGNVWHSQSN